MRKILAIIIIIAGLFAGWVIVPQVVGGIGSVSSRLNAGDEKTITDEIKNVAELSVLEYRFTNATKLTDQKTIKKLNDLKIPFTTKEIVMKYSGVIKLGVNFDNISVEVNKDAAGKLTSVDVKLPEVEVLSNEIDRDSMEFALEKNNLFNQIKTSDYNKLEKQATTEMEKVVKDQGVTDRAMAEVQSRVKALLCGLYGDNIKVNFK